MIGHGEAAVITRALASPATICEEGGRRDLFVVVAKNCAAGWWLLVVLVGRRSVLLSCFQPHLPFSFFHKSKQKRLQPPPAGLHLARLLPFAFT